MEACSEVSAQQKDHDVELSAQINEVWLPSLSLGFNFLSFLIWQTYCEDNWILETGSKGLNEYFNLTRNITQFKRKVLLCLVKIVLILDFHVELTWKELLSMVSFSEVLYAIIWDLIFKCVCLFTCCYFFARRAIKERGIFTCVHFSCAHIRHDCGFYLYNVNTQW